LHRRGHEIGCHTFSHPKVPLLNAKQLADDLDRNAAFFATLIPDIKLENFCFPYGLTSLPRKHQAQARFDSCRSSKTGINHGRIDLGFLKSVPLDHTSDLPTITRYIDETVRLNGWLVLFTHDVSEQPTWIGCTPKLLDAIVTYAMRQGCEVATVKDALRRIGATAQVSA
jgi:peptidoglycan/xylan/chitin deacetylase (PgdA/CDA1 family)